MDEILKQTKSRHKITKSTSHKTNALHALELNVRVDVETNYGMEISV